MHQPHDNLHQQLLQMLSPPRIEEQAASQTSSPMSNKEDSPEPNWGDFSSRAQQQGYHNELDNSFSGLKLGLDNRVPSSVTIRYTQQEFRQSVIHNAGSLALVSTCVWMLRMMMYSIVTKCHASPSCDILMLLSCVVPIRTSCFDSFSSASPTTILVNGMPNIVFTSCTAHGLITLIPDKCMMQ